MLEEGFGFADVERVSQDAKGLLELREVAGEVGTADTARYPYGVELQVQ